MFVLKFWLHIRFQQVKIPLATWFLQFFKKMKALQCCKTDGSMYGSMGNKGLKLNLERLPISSISNPHHMIIMQNIEFLFIFFFFRGVKRFLCVFRLVDFKFDVRMNKFQTKVIWRQKLKFFENKISPPFWILIFLKSAVQNT